MLIERLAGWLHLAAAYVLMPLMAAVVCADVVARYFFSAPFQWAQDVTTLALLVFFVLAIPKVTADDGHIRVETLYERFSPRVRALSDLVAGLAGCSVLALISYRSFADVPGMARRGEGAEMIDLPHWPVALLIAVATALVALLLVVRVVRALCALRAGG